MAAKSRWKAAHDRFPAHVEEAKNSDGNVHRGYHLLEFRVAAELLRIGPVHSAEDYWAPNDWQLLLLISEYMSALLEFLDWFWPDLGWEHHKQAIVLSKRLLQPRSPFTYPDLHIDPQLRAAWQSFTYCFWHGTRHLPTTPPPGDPPALYSAARDWMTKLVGERGLEPEGHISSSLQNWITATQPRLREAFPNVDWSRWPTVVWPDPECACRVVEKRGALKRRQQEEDYAVRWPLRVTQGRPKFNHLKMEARDGFVVGIPSIKNPPALGFLAISDIMCAFKQATQTWPSAVPLSPSYSAQQEIVQSFVQNVLRETRGPLAPGIAHEQYRYLGFVACCALGWQSALMHIAVPLHETAMWGPQALALPGGSAAPLLDRLPMGLHEPLGLGLALAHGQPLAAINMGRVASLGIAAQLALQPQILAPPERPDSALGFGGGLPGAVLPPTAALAATGMQQQQGLPPSALAAGAETAGRAMAGLVVDKGLAAGGPAGAEMGPGSAVGMGPGPASESALSSLPPTPSELAQSSQQGKPTRTRPSPFLARQQSTSLGGPPRVASASHLQPQAGDTASADGVPGPLGQQLEVPRQARGAAAGPGAERVGGQQDGLDGTAAMSLGGLSSMQDLIDGLPSHTDLSWSAILGAVGDDEAAANLSHGHLGPPGALGTLASLSQLQLPSGWPSLRSAAVAAAAATGGPQGATPPPPPPLSPQEPLHGIPSPTGLSTGLSGLQPFDSGLPCGTLSYPLCSFGGVLPPPRAAPDAPVLVQPPSRAGSPFQGTITTGSLPGSGMLAALARQDAAAQEPRLARRSHGEVFTLSPVTSCGPNGETLPCSPALTDTAAAAAAAGAGGAGAGPSGRQSQEGGAAAQRTRERENVPLPTAGRRTRQDVAAAAAAAAADAGLPPAPGSLVERSAKRPNAQADAGPVAGAVTAAPAERVESLGAFLTDQQAGLGCGPARQAPKPADGGCSDLDGEVPEPRRKELGQQLLQVLRNWADQGSSTPTTTGLQTEQNGAAAIGSSAAEVHRQVSELLRQGAPADAAAEVPAGTAGATSGAEEGPRAGYSALHWACLRGDAALAEVLLRHGADPDKKDAAGVPARLVNPAFEPEVTRLAAAAAQKRQQRQQQQQQQQRMQPPATARSTPAVTTAAAARSYTSAFAASGASAAAAVAAGADMPSNGPSAQCEAADAAGGRSAAQLSQHLMDLLQRADQLAGQLAQQDPEAASQLVLQAIQGSGFLSQWMSADGAKQPTPSEVTKQPTV